MSNCGGVIALTNSHFAYLVQHTWCGSTDITLSAQVEYAGVRNPASRNRICSFCARRIDDGACLIRDTPVRDPGVLLADWHPWRWLNSGCNDVAGQCIAHPNCLRLSVWPTAGSNRGAHRTGFAYHLRCMPTNVWAQMSGMPAGFGVIAPDDQVRLSFMSLHDCDRPADVPLLAHGPHSCQLQCV